MLNIPPMSDAQSALINEFYSFPVRKIALTKKQRQEVWHGFKKDRNIAPYAGLSDSCPALYAELSKSLESGKLIQSAVFSECVYAQTLADTYGLRTFRNHLTESSSLELSLAKLLKAHGLVARYIYENSTRSRMLVQAGGHGGVDSALISIQDMCIYTIEFKESLAKTSEPDLPKYGEDGFLVTTDEFRKKYGQFDAMLEEHLPDRLNFFNQMGSNVNLFSPLSVQMAVSNSYNGGKLAEVICTEDKAGYLAMIPATHAHIWAQLQGEIRPSGRNDYQVWTPDRLMAAIKTLEGRVFHDTVSIPFDKLKPSPPRGGTGISRYKINPLFFVPAKDLRKSGTMAEFRLCDVRQLNPTIAAKMHFKKLDVKQLQMQYGGA